MANILVFGASTTYGCWDPEGGWVQRLRKVIDEKVVATKADFEWLVYNLAIDGDDTKGILERFEDEVGRRLWEGEETIIIISAAINDSLFENKTKHLRVPLDEFQKNLERLIEMSQEYSDKVIIVGTQPVDEVKVDPLPWLPTHSYKNEFLREYNEVAKSTARVMGAHFVEIFNELINMDYQKLLFDGVHGNAKGHKFIFDTVRDFLRENQILDI